MANAIRFGIVISIQSTLSLLLLIIGMDGLKSTYHIWQQEPIVYIVWPWEQMAFTIFGIFFFCGCIVGAVAGAVQIYRDITTSRR
jgi:hypothetical protein